MRAGRLQKNFGLGAITRTIGTQRTEINPPKCPVAEEQPVVVMRRQWTVPVTDGARGRTAANRRQDIDRVRIVSGPVPAPLPRGQTPTVMPAKTNVKQSRRRVPGKKKIALNVAVIGE